MTSAITLLEQDVPLPIIFQCSSRFLVVTGLTTKEISEQIAKVARDQGAQMDTKVSKSRIKLTLMAPADDPDEPLCHCICKLTLYVQRDGQRRLDFSHRIGSRIVAANLYRHLAAALIESVTSPSLEGLLVHGKPRPCKVYSVPSLPREGEGEGEDEEDSAPSPPMGVAQALGPLAESAQHDYDKRPAMQLLTRLSCDEGWMGQSIRGGICHETFPFTSIIQHVGPECDPVVQRCLLCLLANLTLSHRPFVHRLLENAQVRHRVEVAFQGEPNTTFYTLDSQEELRKVLHSLSKDTE